MKLLYETPIHKDFLKKPTIFLIVKQCKGQREIYTSVSKCTEKEIDLGSITRTQSAREFYAEQERAKRIFDVIEKENQDFREAVRAFRSYPDNYTNTPYQGYLDRLWGDKCKIYPLLERHCTHATDCKRINNCSCTPKREVEQNEKELEERYQLDHNHKHRSTKHRKKKREAARY